jgi:tetratricopeptide (TPR) repeat protein
VFGLLLGAFGLYAFSGRADHDAARLAICERHARHYGEDWWFLTYLGWSHTEAGNVRAGRTITERAIAIRPQNGNAAHALSHAHFEQGDALAGDAFLSEWLLAHDGKSYLQGHLSWHVALVAVESGDADRALKTYNERIRPSEARYPPLNVFTDCASLLWRLTLGDKTVPASQWNEAAEYGNRFFPRAGAHFADLHHALVAAATDSDSLETRLAELESLEARGSLAPGSSAIDLCRGAKAFAQRDYDKAADLLEAAMPAVVQIGGSHAQRELWEDTLIVACLRSGRNHKAPSSSRLVCSAGPRAAIRHGCGEPRWQQTSRPSAGGRYDAINFTFPRDVKPFTSEIAAIHYIDRQSLSQEAFMSSPRNQHPETRGIDWVAIERIFVLQVLALLALAGAFIGYVNWSSQIAFAEFSAASNRAALESKAHPGSAPAVQAEKRQVPGAGST